MESYWGVDHGEVSKAMQPERRRAVTRHAAQGATAGLILGPGAVVGAGLGAAYGYKRRLRPSDKNKWNQDFFRKIH